MKETRWTVVWPEGKESYGYENTDHYELLETEDAVRYLVQSLCREYDESHGQFGAHEANILVFPPSLNIETTKYL